MAGSADGEGFRGELFSEHHVLLHCDEAESDDWDHPISERFGGSSGVLLCEDMDKVPGESKSPEPAVYQAGEHCYTDLCGC